MKPFLIFQPVAKFFFISFLLFDLSVNAQQAEYRITKDGKYEHINDLKETGMIYDESNGSYYKPISERTFFLEAQKRGFLTADITYAQFIQLPIILRIAAVNQPLAEVIDCSTNFTSPKCLRFTDLVVVVPDADTVIIVPLLELKKLPVTLLERAKLFMKYGVE